MKASRGAGIVARAVLWFPAMRARLSLLLTLAAAAPAIAQPAKPAPAKPAQPVDDMVAFEKDLDALFVTGGLTAEQAAARAGAVSPSVRRRVAEVEAAIAQAETAEPARGPQGGGNGTDTPNNLLGAPHL